MNHQLTELTFRCLQIPNVGLKIAFNENLEKNSIDQMMQIGNSGLKKKVQTQR